MTRFFCNACSDNKTEGCKLKMPSRWKPYLPRKCPAGLKNESSTGDDCPTWVKVKKVKKYGM
jgi:hypothetical protein